MSYTVTTPQPSGLQAGETCVTLDSGQLVAVSLTATPISNNSGMQFFAQARAINADGSTLMHGDVPMLTAGNHLSSHDEYVRLGADVLGKGMVCAMLGETLATETIDSGGVNVTQTIPNIGAAAVTAWSIRNMLAVSANAASVNAAAVI